MESCNTQALSLINVKFARSKYPIYFGNGLLCEDELYANILNSKVLIVTNKTVGSLYLTKLKMALIKHCLQLDEVILEDGEEHKNFLSLNRIYEALIDNKHHRDTTIIALGGGVIGDIAGFAAATYQRGVNLIHIPTTLIGQVDSAIGGKTAINYSLGKNLIGSFYHPKAILIDYTTLKTLPQREFRSGFAEILKYALLTGSETLDLVFEYLKNPLIESSAFSLLIRKCCEIKVQIVKQDEKESGIRAYLNLGHTFAHALESYYDYTRYLHGEAVAIGLYCQALLSYELGLLAEENLYIIDELLLKLNLPNRLPKDIDILKLHALFAYDKKIRDEKLRFILLKDLGKPLIQTHIADDILFKVLTQARYEN